MSGGALYHSAECRHTIAATSASALFTDITPPGPLPLPPRLPRRRPSRPPSPPPLPPRHLRPSRPAFAAAPPAPPSPPPPLPPPRRPSRPRLPRRRPSRPRHRPSRPRPRRRPATAFPAPATSAPASSPPPHSPLRLRPSRHRPLTHAFPAHLVTIAFSSVAFAPLAPVRIRRDQSSGVDHPARCRRRGARLVLVASPASPVPAHVRRGRRRRCGANRVNTCPGISGPIAGALAGCAAARKENAPPHIKR